MTFLKNIKLSVGTLLIASSLTSCLKVDEVPFSVHSSLMYSIQKEEPTGNGDTTYLFQPYFWAQYNGEIKDYSCVGNLGTMLSLDWKQSIPNLLVTSTGYMGTTLLKADSDEEFTLKVTDKLDAVSTNRLKFNTKKADILGQMHVKKFSYKHAQQRVSAQVADVKNADNYFFIFIAEDGFRSINPASRYSETMELTVAVPETGSYRVRIGAMNNGILKESMEEFTIQHGIDSNWEEQAE